MEAMKKEYVKPEIAMLSTNLGTNNQPKGDNTNEGQPGGMVAGNMLTPS